MPVLREALSNSGRPVLLSLDQGTYTGAQPYYSVVILKASGKPLVSRYTPFKERAERLFDKFLQDITDPAQLKEPLHG
jgi:hypothetical protein